MNADRLLELHERISEAPGAIARLRRFVLDLAVRGKLVAQLPEDEPAPALLKRIFEEKTRLAKNGEMRKPKPLPPVSLAPFGLPASWLWTRIREVTTDRGQMIPDRSFTYLDVSAINKEVGIIASPTVLEAADAPSRARKITRKGDVIYSCVRPYLLNVAVVEEDFEPAPIASTAFAIMNGMGLVVPRYIWIVMRSPFMLNCVEETQRGQAYPAINDADFALLPFPLPPLAEQHRIVAKVNELMALCDRLEEARKTREDTRDRLTAASLARLTAPETTDQDFPTHARFALTAFPALTHRPDQIKALRQTILNLAVRGKLVEQDPADEPASEMLKRIARRRQNLAAQGGVRKKKPVEPLADEDVLNLPAGWCADAFANLIDPRATISYGVLVPGSDVEDGVPFVRAQDLMLKDHPERPSKTIAPEIEAPYSRTRLTGGELLLCVVGSIGKLGVAPQHWAGANIARAVVRISPIDLLDRDYVLLFLRSDRAQDYFEEATRTLAQPTLNVGLIETLPVPLPPLAEQHRIVAKVDALMALCDRLEAALATADTTRARLLEALLHEALEPADDVLEAAE